MQMPNGIIEVKLAPTVRFITRSLADFSEQFGRQVDELQASVLAATVATQESKDSAEAASDVQNRHLERIAALLALSEGSLRQLSLRLAPLDRPRDAEGDFIGKPPRRVAEWQRAQPAPAGPAPAAPADAERGPSAEAQEGSGLSRLWRPKR
jgi:hypothetical protein